MTRASNARRKRNLLAYENSLQLARRDVNPNFKRFNFTINSYSSFLWKTGYSSRLLWNNSWSDVKFDKQRRTTLLRRKRWPQATNNDFVENRWTKRPPSTFKRFVVSSWEVFGAEFLLENEYTIELLSGVNSNYPAVFKIISGRR